MKKIRLILNAAVFCLLIVGFSVAHVVLEDKDVSVSERSTLLSFGDVINPEKNDDGSIPHSFEVFEEYMLDQFPLRDTLRSFKALVYTDVFRKNDNNNIYVHDGTAVEIQDTLDEKQVSYALGVFDEVIDRYFSNGNKVYYSIIPDKHYYASKENGYPAMDYEKLFMMVKDNFDGAEYIDITNELELSDFYSTDSHWNQEKIVDIAEKLSTSMNAETKTDYKNGWKKNELSPFYGVYYGRSALSLPHEKIVYLTNDAIDSMTVNVIKTTIDKETYEFRVDSMEKRPVYVKEMFENVDPYDVFLLGPEELLVIENPMADNDRELVIFRDSFGSSITPLIACAYKRVVVVDLRYIVPDALKNCVDIDENADVLFLYSTGMYNNGATISRFQRPALADDVPSDVVENDDEASEDKESVESDNDKTDENTEINEDVKENVQETQKDDDIKTDNEKTDDDKAGDNDVPLSKIEKLDSGILMYDGYAFEGNQLDVGQLNYASGLINTISSRYLNGNKVFVSVIPDKNYHVQKLCGGDLSGYNTVVSTVRNAVPGAVYIDIMNTLELSDYYKTDAHWKQENIIDTANKLLSSMNGSSVGDYQVVSAGAFSGTYLKSGKVNIPKDEIKYVSSGKINSMTASAMNNSGRFSSVPMYSSAYLANTEEYDFFLGGAQTIVTVENPSADNDKELVVFRDSFGSSIAPLLSCGYKKVTLVDIRYIVPDLLANFVDFSDSDVLFLYSANILNNGRILKNFMK